MPLLNVAVGGEKLLKRVSLRCEYVCWRGFFFSPELKIALTVSSSCFNFRFARNPPGEQAGALRGVVRRPVVGYSPS